MRDLFKEISAHPDLPADTRVQLIVRGTEHWLKITARFERFSFGYWRLERYFAKLLKELWESPEVVFAFHPWYESRLIRDNGHGLGNRIREIEFHFSLPGPRPMIAWRQGVSTINSETFDSKLSDMESVTVYHLTKSA